MTGPGRCAIPPQFPSRRNSDMPQAEYSYINAALELRPSEIGGYGYFARTRLAMGEIAMIQGGQILASHVLDRAEWARLGYHCFQVELEFYICPLSPYETTPQAVFRVNHSCEPNCGFRGALSLVSLREIAEGEEITFDYAMCDAKLGSEEWLPMTCHCGSRQCRRSITGDDWRDPILRKRYSGFFQPYLAKMILEDAQSGQRCR